MLLVYKDKVCIVSPLLGPSDQDELLEKLWKFVSATQKSEIAGGAAGLNSSSMSRSSKKIYLRSADSGQSNSVVMAYKE